MKLDVGKYYKTRLGAKAYVAAIGCPFEDMPNNMQAIGWVCDTGVASDGQWTIEGYWIGESENHRLDLMGAWQEPKKECYHDWMIICSKCEVEAPMMPDSYIRIKGKSYRLVETLYLPT